MRRSLLARSACPFRRPGPARQLARLPPFRSFRAARSGSSIVPHTSQRATDSGLCCRRTLLCVPRRPQGLIFPELYDVIRHVANWLPDKRLRRELEVRGCEGLTCTRGLRAGGQRGVANWLPDNRASAASWRCVGLEGLFMHARAEGQGEGGGGFNTWLHDKRLRRELEARLPPPPAHEGLGLGHSAAWRRRFGTRGVGGRRPGRQAPDTSAGSRPRAV